MSVADSMVRELADGPCFMCSGSPIVTVACYLPHQEPGKRRVRGMFYALCGECMAEVADQRTHKAATAAIERRAVAVSDAAPWGRSQ